MPSVLVDTSVWARHLRLGDPELARLLQRQQVLTHPFVITELQSRTLAHRVELVELLSALPRAVRAEDSEIDTVLQAHDLSGRGLALVDLHLLASALLTPARLWSSDRRLQQAAEALGVGYAAPA